MPNIDEGAKQWQAELSALVGAAVKHWREKERKYTASALSDRCAALGYPISRVAISKIENNTRAGKLELAELLVLARALDVSPVQLIFSKLPDGRVRTAPSVEDRAVDALFWFEGRGHTQDRDSSNQRYQDANKWASMVEELAALESTLARKTSQIRHPYNSAPNADGEARREVLAKTINETIDRLNELEEDMVKVGLFVDPEREI